MRAHWGLRARCGSLRLSGGPRQAEWVGRAPCRVLLIKKSSLKTGPRQATALVAETPGTTEGAGNWHVGLAGALDHGLVSWITDTSALTLYLRHFLSIDHSSHVDSPVSSLYVYTAPATRRVRTTRAAELTNMLVTLWERAFNSTKGLVSACCLIHRARSA